MPRIRSVPFDLYSGCALNKLCRPLGVLLFLASLSFAAQALTLTGVQSRKVHAGDVRDLPVDSTKAVSDGVSVDPRHGTPGHEIVFQFDTMITQAGNAAVTDETGAAIGFTMPSVNGNEVSIAIPSLPDAKRVTLRLTSVNNLVGADFSASLGFLVGDANGSGNINAADISQVKGRTGLGADAGNARFDFNVSGVVSAADVSTVKARPSRTLPPAYTVGGAVTGLTGTLVLQRNGGDDLYISDNGRYVFPSASSGLYNVTVAQQPAGQVCTVANGTGTVAAASVGNVDIACATPFAVSIYDIKTGAVPTGSLVRLTNQLVTSIKTSSGFFLQTKFGDPGYTNSDFSGLFVAYAPSSPAISEGNRVDVFGVVQTSGGQVQLAASQVTVVNAFVGALPAAVAVANAADVATGGPRAAMLEGVIVSVSSVQVTATNPAQGEFTVTGGLLVDDLLFAANPMPTVGQTFATLTGTLATLGNASKLLPHKASDLVLAVRTFGPAQSYVRAGDMASPTFPTALTFSLGTPSVGPTFVQIVSSDPSSLSVPGGGVTIPDGQSSAVVLLDGLMQSGGVTLTATLGAQVLTSTVRVLGNAEQPALTSLTPAATTLAAGGSATFQVNLDIPAPAGGTSVTLVLNPANAGLIPATITVPANALSASFQFMDAGTVNAAQLVATLGADSFAADLTMSSGGEFVINEVDYDQVGTDAASYIELFNGSSSAVNLSEFAVVLINGSNNTEYARYALGAAGSQLAPGQYLILRNSTVTVPSGVLTLDVAGDFIQNGAPDGIALINTVTQTVIDSLSYEGPITAALITGFANPVNLVRGTALSAAVADSNTSNGSLCRIPNGIRTNNDATDWRFCTQSTPGAANTP